MTDPKKMSVEEILAACRKADGGGAGADDAAAPASQPESTSDPAASHSASGVKPAAGKKPSEMSVDEMLAAARAEKSGGSPQAAAKPAAAKPAVTKSAAASGKKPGAMSVEEMLAAARAETSKPSEKASKPAATQAKKARPPAGESPAVAKKAPATAEGPKETESILAAARRSAKPGPISKAEAAALAGQRGVTPQARKKGVVPPMPEKPAYARPAPTRGAAVAEGESRRGFLGSFVGVFLGSSLAAGFSSLLVTHVLWLLGLARFMFPNILTEPPTKFKVGFPDDYAPGQVETKYKAEFGIWLVRYEYEGQPQIYAIQSVCTHLGCTPNWLEGEQKFKCPCHGSGFYKDGINFEGPAPRPLERFAIRLADDGQLEVDKSQKFLEEKGEWKDAASFVPV